MRKNISVEDAISWMTVLIFKGENFTTAKSTMKIAKISTPVCPEKRFCIYMYIPYPPENY